MWAWLTLGGVVLFFFLRKGVLGKVGGLVGTVADTANAAVNTVRNVGANLDPFNSKGKAAAVLRAVDPSKPVKQAGKAISKAANATGKAVSKAATATGKASVAVITAPVKIPVKVVSTAAKTVGKAGKAVGKAAKKLKFW